MRIEKKQLLQIIKESQVEMDEMSKFANPEYRPLYDENRNLVGHRMRIDRNNPESPSVNVIFTCGQDIGQFIEQHRDLIDKIKEKNVVPGDEYIQKEMIFTNDVCPKYVPHGKKERQYYDETGKPIESIAGGRYQHRGVYMSLKEKINRDIKKVLYEQLTSDSELANHMAQCSIPFFKVRERSYEDRHDVDNNNERIHYGLDVLNLYESSNDFLLDVLNKTMDLESDIKARETHLARLRNKIRKRWNPRKKNEKKFEGLTDVYKLEKRGFAQENYDVNIMSRFDLLGERIDTYQFIWKLQLKVTYGKKVDVENEIDPRNVKEYKVITEIKYVDTKNSNEYTEENYILKDPQVWNKLLEAIYDFKKKLMEISPNDAIEMANYYQNEIERMDESFNKLIKEVLKENGFKKTIRIKEKDLIKLISESVKTKLSEGEKFDDFITKSQSNQEENKPQPNDDENRNIEDVGDNADEKEENNNSSNLTLAQDDEGNFYILQNAYSNSPVILAKTK